MKKGFETFRHSNGAWLLFCLIVSLLLFLPVLKVDANLVNSRCFYLPSAGLSILLAAGIFSTLKHVRNAMVGFFIAAVVGGAALLVHNQEAVLEAGKECKAFTEKVRAAGIPIMVVPRMEYFPYADKDGDGVLNDEGACFAPTGESGETKMALLIDVPRLKKGVYIFWGGVEWALLPLFGSPGVDILFTEMYTEKAARLAPDGSFLGPLLDDGVPLLKWDGGNLVRVMPEKIEPSSLVGRDMKKAEVSPLGPLRLVSTDRFDSERFDPVMTMAVPAEKKGTFRYRILNPLGTTIVPAEPELHEGLLRFDPWNETAAAPLFRAVRLLKTGEATNGQAVYDYDHIYYLLFVEQVEEGVVKARSRHLMLRVDFND